MRSEGKPVRQACPWTLWPGKMEGEGVFQTPDQRSPCSLWRTPQWNRSHGGPYDEVGALK